MTTEIRPPAAHQRPSGRLYLDNNQLNLVDGVKTLVELDTISAGFTDGIEDTAGHRITPGQAGYYHIIGSAMFANAVADRGYVVYIRRSGGVSLAQNNSWSGGGGYFSAVTACLAKLTATDYIELCVRSDAGVDTVDLLGKIYATFLSVQRVR